ncbi:PAS domain S-box protein [Bradyrhizobium sp. AUGA SZCCT0177]|uniref:PAS domain S-box protein n=1 Tax=Bradyrhizobium sp. AUGA SZCCT0177 TaxID=2807665 RepID=UPI001BABE0FC|nr:PAS domain S-box protein [Bradyrhizobium sp. AUGA SZCCT0177]MBR1287707.1 PAS domain S-box protein [Bradyrhizobium sp. AUGA SZCCT0177]
MSVFVIDADQDVNELIRTLQARESELALIHRIAGIGGVEVDLRDGYRNRRSPEYLAIHGLPPTATNESHESWVARIHPEDRIPTEQQFLDALAGATQLYSAEYRIVRPSDGQTRWVRVAAQIERDSDGRPVRLIGAHFDVTDSKLAERILRESEERFRSIANSAPIPMWVTQLNGERSFVNQAYSDFFALSHDEALKLDWRSRVHPDDAAQLAEPEQLRTLVPNSNSASGNPFPVQIRIARGNGDWRWVNAVSRPRFDEHGHHIGFIGVAHDITAEKQAEIELRASEERFRLMAENAPVMIWISDEKGSCVHLNQMLREFWGVSEKEVPAFEWSSTLHPEDKAIVIDEVASAIEKQSMVSLKARYLDAKGRYRTLEARAHPRFSPLGEFLGMIGANVDVTERQEAEKARELLVDELNHRVKNTLSVVQAIAHQSFNKNVDPVLARRAFEGRLVALGQAHDLLTHASWENASLAELAELTLDSKGTTAGQIFLTGPTILLSPKQAVSLAMAFHELCTNARKYGALSTNDGQVHVEWTRIHGAEPQVHILWSETGGPPVSVPTRRGFGSTLLERTLAEDLDGQVTVQFDPIGLRCSIALPIPYAAAAKARYL